MDQNIKVTVVIPVYNTEDYVEQTIESICAQTLDDIEIIAINDGSRDGSLRIMEAAAAHDPRIRVLSQQNRGLSLTRNRGIAEARGEFIYFMDSDDLLEPDTLELCYDKCKAERLDLVIFDADVFSDEGGFELGFDYMRSHLIEDKVYAGEEMMRALMDTGGYRSSACLCLVRTGLLRELGLEFYPGILHEDELYTPQLLLGAARAGRIDRAFFHRRMRPGSIMTATYSPRTIEGYKTVLTELRKYAAGREASQAELVERRVREVLNAVVFNASTMPLQARMDLLGWSLKHFSGTVSAKNMARLLVGRKK